MNWETLINHPLFFFIIAFVASFGATVILFKFLKSQAVIIKPSWRAGGAIAGFIIIFTISFYATDKWLDKYLSIERRYDIEGIILLDSSHDYSGIDIKEVPFSAKDKTQPDGSYRLKGIKFNQNEIDEIEIQFERQNYFTLKKRFDQSRFSIDNEDLIIHIHDTVTLIKIPDSIINRTRI